MITEINNQSPNHWISDEEMDSLITESLARQVILEEIGSEVMKQVRRHSRHDSLRRWARLVAFAFGVPFVLACFAFGAYYVYTSVGQQTYVWASLAVAAVVLMAYLGREVKDFSIREV